MNAADIRNPEILGAITPPSCHDMLGSSSASLLNGGHEIDVDVRGPMGTTPLMIASFRGNGSGLDSGDLSENGTCDLEGQESSAAVIQELISQVL